MRALEPNKIYVNKEMRVFYYTDYKRKLIGTYITKEGAEEGLRVNIKRRKEIEDEKLTPHSST